MRIYHYDPISGALVFSSDARPDPAEHARTVAAARKAHTGKAEFDPANFPPTKFLVPAFATSTTPPDATDGKRVVFKGGAWSLEDVPVAKNDAAPIPNWDDIRSIRNGKLADCDWTQLPDSPLGFAVKQAWADYRKALRDMSFTGDVTKVTWPIAPEGK